MSQVAPNPSEGRTNCLHPFTKVRSLITPFYFWSW